MAEPADLNVEELRRRARRRLVGAVVLALGVAVIVPMLLETEQKPLGDDVSVKIPPVDDSKFVNRLSEKGAKDTARTAAKASSPSKDDAAKDAAAANAAPASPDRTSKYDTRLADAPAGGTPPATPASASTAGGAPANAGGTTGAKPAQTSAASEPAAAPLPAIPKASPATPPYEGFAVQLAAFADDKGANSLAGRLKRAGYAAYTEPLKTSKGTLWRVRVGPYPTHEAAVAARDKLKAEGQSGIVAAIK